MTESKSAVHYVTPKRTHTRHLVEIATHLSPRWGFREFGLLVCYTHAAPLGLQHKDEKTVKQGSPNKNQCAVGNNDRCSLQLFCV